MGGTTPHSAYRLVGEVYGNSSISTYEIPWRVTPYPARAPH